MLEQLRRWWFRWRRRRAFARLSPAWQKLIRFIGDDPESLEERENRK